MAKNTNRVASAIAYVAALGLATGAWAAHWEMTVNNAVTYATEIFGGDDAPDLTLSKDDPDTTDDASTTDVVENDEQTSVDLKLYLPNDASESVASGSELEVTLHLKGGSLAQAINWTDIEVTGEGFAKVGGSQEDGRNHDNMVTLKVSATADITVSSTIVATNKFAVASGRSIRFNIGSIEGYNGAGMVIAEAEARVTDGPASSNFPTMMVQTERTAVEAVQASDGPDGTADTADDVAAVAGVDATSNRIANSKAAMTFGAAGGGTPGLIDIDDRTALDGMTKVEIASFTHEGDDTAMTAGGDESFSETAGTMANVMVTVTGMVRNGDTIWFDQDDNAMMGSRETLTVSGASATRTFRISNITSGGSVYFQPNGDDDMSAGNLKADFAIEYDDEDAVTPMGRSGTVALEYSGIKEEAIAYAIPRSDVNDVGNVRIRCEEESDDAECTVFLDCDDEGGESYFRELGSTISGGHTEVLSSGMIADLLGELWTGRLACEIFSDKNVSAQVLVRSGTGHALINNTYVSGAEPAE